MVRNWSVQKLNEHEENRCLNARVTSAIYVDFEFRSFIALYIYIFKF